MNFFDKIFGRKKTVQTFFLKDELTEEEKQICKTAQLPESDGLLLKKLTQQAIIAVAFEQEYTKAVKPIAIGSITSESMSKKIVLENLEFFKQLGKYIFVFGLAESGYIVAITGATNNPYTLMEYAETNGANYGIETEDIIAKLKKWDNEFGIIPVGIGFDFCECHIKNTNIDFKKLAMEVYEFCPDVVDQGTETVEALEEEIKESGTIYLWWD